MLISHLEVPQGGTKTHTFEIRSAGDLIDPDNDDITGSIIQPSSGSNPPTVANIRKDTKGVWKADITADPNSTLSDNLEGTDEWQVRYDFKVNGVTPDTEDRTFEFSVVGAAEATEGNYYATVSDIRPGFMQRFEDRTGLEGTEFYLESRDGIEVATLKKDGTELTEVDSAPGAGEFSFTRPDSITLGEAAVASDVFDITVNVYVRDSLIEDRLDDIHNTMETKLAGNYELPFSGNVPQLANIQKALTRYVILRRAQSMVELNVGDNEMQSYREEYEDAKEQFAEIVNGRDPLRDSNGDTISRKSTNEDTGNVSLSSSAHDPRGGRFSV